MKLFNTDSIYLIGKTHKVCQDYALSEFLETEDAHPFLIISDGCSSSFNSDIGARILAQCAKVVYYSMFDDLQYDDKSYFNFGSNVITMALAVVGALRLNHNCLDATLILSFLQNDHIVTFMYGDGCILKHCDIAGPKYIEVRFLSGAPYYLSYWTNKRRRLKYKDEFNDKVAITFDDDSQIKTDTFNYNSPLRFMTLIDEHKSFVICSDGLSTFYNSTGESINLSDIAKEVLAFKTTTGEFLKRRVSKIVTDNSIKKIYNMDDISLAAVTFTESGFVPNKEDLLITNELKKIN